MSEKDKPNPKDVAGAAKADGGKRPLKEEDAEATPIPAKRPRGRPPGSSKIPFEDLGPSRRRQLAAAAGVSRPRGRPRKLKGSVTAKNGDVVDFILPIGGRGDAHLDQQDQELFEEAQKDRIIGIFGKLPFPAEDYDYEEKEVAPIPYVVHAPKLPPFAAKTPASAAASVSPPASISTEPTAAETGQESSEEPAISPMAETSFADFKRRFQYIYRQSKDDPKIEEPIKLGEGFEKDVFLAKDLEDNGLVVAVGVYKQLINRDGVNFKRLLDEIQSTHRFAASCSFIVQITAFAFEPQKNDTRVRPHIVMAYLPGGSLSTVIERKREANAKFPSDLVREWLWEIATALQVVHQTNHAHRDCKPANILVTADGVACLADFGVLGEGPEMTEYCGTAGYMARDFAESSYSKSVDVFAYGQLILEIFDLLPPYWHEYREEPSLLAGASEEDYVDQRIGAGLRPYNWETAFGDEYELAVLHKMCTKRFAEQRFNIEEVVGHPALFSSDGTTVRRLNRGRLITKQTNSILFKVGDLTSAPPVAKVVSLDINDDKVESLIFREFPTMDDDSRHCLAAKLEAFRLVTLREMELHVLSADQEAEWKNVLEGEKIRGMNAGDYFDEENERGTSLVLEPKSLEEARTQHDGQAVAPGPSVASGNGLFSGRVGHRGTYDVPKKK